jgi:hypothetical protein
MSEIVIFVVVSESTIASIFLCVCDFKDVTEMKDQCSKLWSQTSAFVAGSYTYATYNLFVMWRTSVM